MQMNWDGILRDERDDLYQPSAKRISSEVAENRRAQLDTES